MIQLFVSLLLFFVLFFGISFILNMILRQTWLMAFVFPFIVILIIDEFPFSRYFQEPISAFRDVGQQFISLTLQDGIILSSGFIGTILAGVVIRYLRRNGYQMF
ncbi:YuiB family protein [Saliterribacillus persicus]|uniref:YuiB-like putative membrane protein n=1 Tax=Saliterribacillus persicus TaxID=930114 RepID=A0A368XIU5_9BACI|nr:YuiB family protein [Saliterribacillus persicus]RCW66938.1 YuiB-like putative membrane protein [Saliterribacillus persicus]